MQFKVELLKIFLCIFCFCVEGTVSETSGSEDVLMQISTGQLQGRKLKTGSGNVANIFLGIPYGKDTGGPNRFKPSSFAGSWDGIKDVREYGPACPSNSSFSRHPPKTISEDCLNLDVIAPVGCTHSKPCAVIMYVFGGMFYFGSSQEFSLEILVDNYAADDVIFVIPEYRLGMLGYWSNEEGSVKENSMYYDLLLALKWIQKEIGYFNGNPKRVSIMGHSSGSMAAGLLALSPSATPYYHQLILMSGPPVLENCEAVQIDFSKGVGCDPEELKIAKRSVAECMRSVPLKTILKVQEDLLVAGKSCSGGSMDGPEGLFPFPMEELQRIRKPASILLGNTLSEYGNQEITSALPQDSDTIVASVCAVNAKIQKFKHIDAVTKGCVTYFDDVFSNKTAEAKELLDTTFFLGMFQEGTSLLKVGSDVYYYSFDYVKAGLEGTVPYHSWELAWIVGLNNSRFPFTAEDKRIRDYWVPLFSNFAKYGNPTPYESDPDLYFKPVQKPNGKNYYSVNLPKPRNMPYFHYHLQNFWEVIAPEIDRFGSSKLHLASGDEKLVQTEEISESAQEFHEETIQPSWVLPVLLTAGLVSISGFILVVALFGFWRKGRQSPFKKRRMYIDLEIEGSPWSSCDFESSTEQSKLIHNDKNRNIKIY